MKFLNIKLYNFFSFGPKEEALDLSNPGLYLILGENGVGKSVIIDAITYALFGKVTKDVNINKIINEQSNANTKVELSFELNGNVYWIARYRKHQKYKNQIRFFKNDRTSNGLISKADNNDTQEKINNLIRFNYGAFQNAILMTQESVIGFLEADAKKKKEIIESILQLEIFNYYYNIAKEKRKILNRRIEKFEIEVDALETVKHNYMKIMEDYIKSCGEQQKSAKKEIENTEKEIDDINKIDIDSEIKLIKEAEELSQQIEQKKIDYQRHVDKIEMFNREVETFDNSKLEYIQFVNTNKKVLKKLEKEVITDNKNIKELQLDLKKIKENPEQCPVCNNLINVDKIKIYLNNKEEALNVEDEKLVAKVENINNTKIQVKGWKEKISEIDKQIKDVDEEIKKEQKEAEIIKQEYDSIEIPKTKDEKYLKELSKKKEELKLKIEVLGSKGIVDRKYLNTIKDKFNDAKKDVDKKKIELKQKNLQWIMYHFWENKLSSKKNSMKSWCINNIIGYFNARIKYYTDRFFDGKIEIQIDNELNETIKSDEFDRSFGQFSAGQKRRLNLSILFALNSLVKANISTKINIMFLDEILSNFLDDKGISVVLELLEEMKENKETVFIIDHRDNFKNYPSFNNIDVVKDNNDFSHIKIN